MPRPERLVKAQLREISWGKDRQAREKPGDPVVPVQFNPETLKVSFANRTAGGNSAGGGAKQFVGTGTTKLSFDLWFDVTVAKGEDDVRKLTERIVYFITPKRQPEKPIPPGARFSWGTFLFDGIVDSIQENLEFFSADGKPLRASVAVSMSRQEIQHQIQSGSLDDRILGPGTELRQRARQGDTLQSLAARAGEESWQDIGHLNDVENPRHLEPGALIETHLPPAVGRPRRW